MSSLEVDAGIVCLEMDRLFFRCGEHRLAFGEYQAYALSILIATMKHALSFCVGHLAGCLARAWWRKQPEVKASTEHRINPRGVGFAKPSPMYISRILYPSPGAFLEGMIVMARSCSN